VTIDVGTGDGRAVLASAAREPSAFVVGLDADAASMVEASRRASAPVKRGGTPNVMFLVGAAETLPVKLAGLAGVASLVTVRFPWGSLLRGCLGRGAAVARGIAALLAADGLFELLLAPSPRDRIDGLPIELASVEAAVARAFEPFGLRLVEAREATAMEIRESHSTWARRLFGQRAARLEGRTATSVARTVVLIRLRSSST
jgi:16S rRNA (adenine(1408)-N(1))-methyltransferase